MTTPLPSSKENQVFHRKWVRDLTLKEILVFSIFLYAENLILREDNKEVHITLYQSNPDC